MAITTGRAEIALNRVTRILSITVPPSPAVAINAAQCNELGQFLSDLFTDLPSGDTNERYGTATIELDSNALTLKIRLDGGHIYMLTETGCSGLRPMFGAILEAATNQGGGPGGGGTPKGIVATVTVVVHDKDASVTLTIIAQDPAGNRVSFPITTAKNSSLGRLFGVLYETIGPSKVVHEVKA